MSGSEALPDMIGLYEEVALITGRMLSAAQQRDWDELSRLERGCARCVERLSHCADAPRLTDEIRRQKISLLRRILANDRETQALTEPWTRSITPWTTQTACKRLNTTAQE